MSYVPWRSEIERADWDKARYEGAGPYIGKLEAENARLAAELDEANGLVDVGIQQLMQAMRERDQAVKERDAALRDIGRTCGNCAHDSTITPDEPFLRTCGHVCETLHETYHETACDGWEWRGLEDDHAN